MTAVMPDPALQFMSQVLEPDTYRRMAEMEIEAGQRPYFEVD